MSKPDERKASPSSFIVTGFQLEANMFRFGGDDVSFFDVNRTTWSTFSVQMQKGVSLEEESTKEIVLKEAIEPA